MLLLIIIYLAGYFCSYYTFRYLVKKYHKSWEWGDIAFVLYVSILSWAGFVSVLIAYRDLWRTSKLFKNKPPR